MAIRFSKFNIKLIFVFSLFFLLSLNTLSNTLKEAYIDVKLEENGDAKIKTRWTFKANKGTENFIVIGNLGDSKIKNFKVSENGVPFKYQQDWDINKSRIEKKGKYGIVKKRKTYKLCWGFGDYGTHIFDIEYDITNMIKTLKDAQMLNFQFMNSNMENPPTQVKIVIHADKPFTEDDIKMWSFGFKGNIHLVDGKIVAKSKRQLIKDEYVTILLRFDENYFNATSHVNKTFEKIQKKSFKRSDYSKKWFSFILVLWNRKIVFIPLLLKFIFLILSLIESLIIKKLMFFSFRGEYYLDIPYEGNLEDIFSILLNINLTSDKNIVTAYFLKYVKNRTIEVVPKDKLSMSKKKEVYFKTNNINYKMSIFEKRFYNFLLSAADKNRILEDNEFKKWSKKNQHNINSFFTQLKSDSDEIMTKNGYLKKVKVRKFLFFKKEKNVLTEKGVELKNNIIKFYNYLDNFSLLNEKTSPNVHLWDEYMIYAALFGITKKVRKEFNKLYPEYDKLSALSKVSISSIEMTSSNFCNSYRSAYNFANSGNSSSSGGGSSSSSGGRGSSRFGGRGGRSR